MIYDPYAAKKRTEEEPAGLSKLVRLSKSHRELKGGCLHWRSQQAFYDVHNHDVQPLTVQQV